MKGLTTAAAIWVVAAVGMACGAGLLIEAIAATLLTLATLILLRMVERRLLPHRVAQHHTIQIEVSETTGQLLSSIYTLCQQQQVMIEKLDIGKKRGAESEQKEIVKIACHAKEPMALTATVGKLGTLPEVQAVHVDMQLVDVTQSGGS